MPIVTMENRQCFLNPSDGRTPYSFSMEAQNPIQIIQICQKRTCFSKLFDLKHLQEDWDPLILWTLKATGSRGVNTGIRIFSPTFIRCLQSFSEKDVQKKNHFCEILESFLVCLTISIVASIINSLQILLPFLITASIKIIPKYFNLLTQKAFRKVRNVIHINKVVNVIKYFWHLFLEVKLGLCLSILETMSKAANTVDWGKHHLRNS